MALRVPEIEPRFGRLMGLGGYRPRRLVGNTEVCVSMDSTEEWIESHSGIRTRRYAEADETLRFMASAAAEKAIANAGIDPWDVGHIILATTSNLVLVPPAAAAVAHGVGAVNAGVADLNSACAGFCHAVALAENMIRCGSAEYVVVVAAERLTDLMDPTDRQISFLLADGAGAAVLGPSSEPGVGPVVWGTDGSQQDAIAMSRSWADFRADPALEPPAVRMDGRRVFRWVVSDVVPAAQRAMEAAGVTVDEIDAFIPHQANLRITDVLVDALGLPSRVAVATEITDIGNTSSASIPLAAEHMLESGAVESGSLALLVGFGAGLMYAAQVVRMP